MSFLNYYKNYGGRVTTGADSAGQFDQFGFRFIRELKLLQEAGFSPLEVFRAATLMAPKRSSSRKARQSSLAVYVPGSSPISSSYRRTQSSTRRSYMAPAPSAQTTQLARYGALVACVTRSRTASTMTRGRFSPTLRG